MDHIQSWSQMGELELNLFLNGEVLLLVDHFPLAIENAHLGLLTVSVGKSKTDVLGECIGKCDRTEVGANFFGGG